MLDSSFHGGCWIVPGDLHPGGKERRAHIVAAALDGLVA